MQHDSSPGSEYWQRETIFRSIPFEKANEGKPIKTKAPLFQLPIELMEEIMKHVTSNSLRRFALASQECCQLARTQLFAEVILDYSRSSIDMLHKLARECIERDRNGGKTKLPSLGACIRRVTFATDPSWIDHRWHRGIDVRKDHTTQSKEAAEAYYKNYFSFLTHVLRNGLPNLESFGWYDRVVVDKDFFEALALSRVRDLTLSRISVLDVFEIEQDILKDCEEGPHWPLRSLEMGPKHGLGEALQLFEGLQEASERKQSATVDTNPLLNSILRLCAPYLEHLNWWCSTIEDETSIPSSPGNFGDGPDNVPRFPALRTLRLQCVPLKDDTVLKAFIPDKACILRKLDLKTDDCHHYLPFLQARGTISSLQSLTLSCQRDEGSLQGHLQFIAANPQLTSLFWRDELPADFIDDHLLPLLNKSFQNLTSLHLVWASDEIPETALLQLGTLSTLQRLHLGTQKQPNDRGLSCWVIDHELIRRYLKALPNLSRLAFSEDTYQLPVPWARADTYYRDRIRQSAIDQWQRRQTNALPSMSNPPSSTPSIGTLAHLQGLVDTLSLLGNGNGLALPQEAEDEWETEREEQSSIDLSVEQEAVEQGEEEWETESDSTSERDARAITGNDSSENSDGEGPVDEASSDEDLSDLDEDEDPSDLDDNYEPLSSTRRSNWFNEHRDRMEAIANNYFLQFESLEWIYFGRVAAVREDFAQKLDCNRNLMVDCFKDEKP